MATKIEYLTYYIVLTDPDRVAELQATPEYLAAGGIARAPYNPGPPEGGAAIEFSAPFRGYTEPAAGEAPFTWTPFSGAGSQDGPYPLDVATFQRHTGGFWGIGGTTTRYYWIGKVVLAPGAAPASPTGGPAFEKAVLAKRHILEGFEIPGGVGYDAMTNKQAPSRDAARHVGGLGLALRGSDSAVTIAGTLYNAGFVNPGAWVRMYVRLRRLPGAATTFFRVGGTPSAAAGFGLRITPAGTIAIFNITSGSVQSLLGTVGQLEAWDGTADGSAGWHKLDILFAYNTAASAGAGAMYVHVDGKLEAAFSISDADGGLGQNSSRIQNFQIGNGLGTANTLDLDVDDVVISDLPPGRELAGGVYSKLWLAYDGGSGPTHGDYSIDDVVISPEVLDPDVETFPRYHVYKAIVANRDKQPRLAENGTYWHRYEGFDWINGSKIALIRPTEFGSAHDAAAWPGFAGLLAQRGFGASTTIPTLASSTADGQVEVETDAGVVLDNDTGALGPGLLAFVLMMFSTRGTTSGTLGYKLGAAAAVDTAVTQGTSQAWNGIIYTVDGSTVKDPVDVTPLKLRHAKGNAANAATLKSLIAMGELIGLWDQSDYNADVAVRLEEDAEDPEMLRFVGQHNSPYPYSPTALDAAAAPNSPYIVKGGTYTGNATGQDLTFRAPVHLLWIRPLTGGAGGYLWTSSMLTGKKSSEAADRPGVITVEEDPTFAEADGEDVQQARYRVRIAGDEAQVNANAVTYQYIAVMDPGGRFLLNHTIARASDETGSRDYPLINPNFLPEFVFAWIEALATTATVRNYAQGPGGTAAKMCTFAGGSIASAITPALGKVSVNTNWAAIMLAASPLSLWRRQDGNDDPGEPGVVAFGTFIGDGAASRTISIAPASGRRPLFAAVYSEQSGQVGFTRDPSNSATQATDSTGTNSTSAITSGGIDSFTVASQLNTTGVIHHWFVLFADATAGNGGWGVNGEYIPVEAASPADGPWPPDPDEDDVTGGGGGEEPDPDEPIPGEPDLDTEDVLSNSATNIGGLVGGQVCEVYTRAVVNRALKHIGVSRRIANLATDVTEEAISAREIVKEDINTVLRDHPWPFATRYANLVLVAGTADVPVNADWQYSYRGPNAMMFARRIVGQDDQRREFDPDPIKFRTGMDDDGPLIYTDAIATADVPLVLEYTLRFTCPAFYGDALFRETLAWKFAHSLAPALAKDAKRADACWRMYQAYLTMAKVPAQREQQQPRTDATDADWISGR